MPDVPVCRNSRRQPPQCARSDVKLIGENDSAWIFRCATCECVQVISKDGVRDKSKFEALQKRKAQQEQLDRINSRRRKIFH